MNNPIAILLGATLLAFTTPVISQDLPPRQIGSLDVNALTTAPLWTIRTAEIDAEPSEIFDYVSNSLADSDESERDIVTSNSPSMFAWQLTDGDMKGVSDHLSVINVMSDQEDGKGSIISISVFFNHPDIKATLPVFEDSSKTITTSLINKFGGSLANNVSGSETVKISTTRTVNASKAEVWKVLAEDFDKVAEWSSLISEAQFLEGNDGEGLVGGKRSCFIPSFGDSVEEVVTTYDKDKGVLAYDVVEGMPSFVTQGFNTFEIVAIDDNTTQVSSTITMEVASQTPGLAIGMAKQNFAQAASMSLDELVYFVENGRPHPREIASREAG